MTIFTPMIPKSLQIEQYYYRDQLINKLTDKEII